MTTHRQVKKLFAPLLERHADLAVVGYWLMIKPITHVLRGVAIAPSSSADTFYPTWAVTHFCEPTGWYPINWGRRIYLREANWEWTDPRMPDVLLRVVDEDVLPMLRAVSTLHDMLQFIATPERFQGRCALDPLSYVPLHTALGNLKEARDMLTWLRTVKPPLYTGEDIRDEYEAMALPLEPLFDADDRAGMAAVLHGWEAMRIARLKMQSIWESTPFPLEEMAPQLPSTPPRAPDNP